MLHRVDGVFSTWRDDSELMRLRRGELVPARAHPWLAEVARLCAEARPQHRWSVRRRVRRRLATTPPGWSRAGPSNGRRCTCATSRGSRGASTPGETCWPGAGRGSRRRAAGASGSRTRGRREPSPRPSHCAPVASPPRAQPPAGRMWWTRAPAQAIDRDGSATVWGPTPAVGRRLGDRPLRGPAGGRGRAGRCRPGIPVAGALRDSRWACRSGTRATAATCPATGSCTTCAAVGREGATRTYPGARDRTPPPDDRALTLPGEMFFALGVADVGWRDRLLRRRRGRGRRWPAPTS